MSKPLDLKGKRDIPVTIEHYSCFIIWIRSRSFSFVPLWKINRALRNAEVMSRNGICFLDLDEDFMFLMAISPVKPLQNTQYVLGLKLQALDKTIPYLESEVADR